MREICQSGSEGGGSRTQSVLPTPIRKAVRLSLQQCTCSSGQQVIGDLDANGVGRVNAAGGGLFEARLSVETEQDSCECQLFAGHTTPCSQRCMATGSECSKKGPLSEDFGCCDGAGNLCEQRLSGFVVDPCLNSQCSLADSGEKFRRTQHE